MTRPRSARWSAAHRPRARWPVAVLGAALLAGCSGTRVDAPVQASTSPSQTPASAVLAVHDVGGDGWALAVTDDDVWVQVDPPVDAVVRVDKATGEASPVVPGGWRPRVAPEGLWVSSGGWVVQVDPATGRQSHRVEPGGAFALAEGSGWLRTDDGVVSKVDLGSGAMRTLSSVPPEQCVQKDITTAFGAVWLACKEGQVVRVPLDGGPPAAIATGAGSHTFAVTEDAVWVTNYLDDGGSISRIDPRTRTVTTVKGVGGAVGITVGGGFVWSGDPQGIARIDPATARVVGHLAVPPGDYYDLAWDDGVIWASTRGSRLLKIAATP